MMSYAVKSFIQLALLTIALIELSKVYASWNVAKKKKTLLANISKVWKNLKYESYCGTTFLITEESSYPLMYFIDDS